MGVALVLVPVVSARRLCSESGEDVVGEVEGAELSAEEELAVGCAVTVVDDNPEEEEEEEVDLGMAAAAAASAGLGVTSGVSVPVFVTGALNSWLEPPDGAGGLCNTPSGRMAVPKNNQY